MTVPPQARSQPAKREGTGKKKLMAMEAELKAAKESLAALQLAAMSAQGASPGSTSERAPRSAPDPDYEDDDDRYAAYHVGAQSEPADALAAGRTRSATKAARQAAEAEKGEHGRRSTDPVHRWPRSFQQRVRADGIVAIDLSAAEDEETTVPVADSNRAADGTINGAATAVPTPARQEDSTTNVLLSVDLLAGQLMRGDLVNTLQSTGGDKAVVQVLRASLHQLEKADPTDDTGPHAANRTTMYATAETTLPKRAGPERRRVQPRVAVVKNQFGAILIGDVAPRKVILDTGAQPVMMGRNLFKLLGLTRDDVRSSQLQIKTAAGTLEGGLGELLQPLKIDFKKGTADETTISVPCLTTSATSYDLLLGMDALYQLGMGVDPWTEHAFYRPGWRTQDKRIALLELDLVTTAHPSREPTVLLANLAEDGDTPTTLQKQPTKKAGRKMTPQPIWDDNRPDFRAMAARAYDEVFAGYNSDAALESLPRLPMPLTTTHEVTPINSRTINWDPPPDGVVLVELFAGLATGLAAALAQGIRIRRYVYVDVDPVAQIAAQARVGQLLDHYPTLLPSDAVRGFQSTWPHDVKLIGAAAFAASGPVDMVIAGWECQGHSRAGAGRGLLDHRSALFFELVRLTNLLQAAQVSSPAYIFENVYSGDDRRHAVRQDFQVVRQYLGHEFAFDAAQVGARAHRYRAYWTNLAPHSLPPNGAVEDPATRRAYTGPDLRDKAFATASSTAR